MFSKSDKLRDDRKMQEGKERDDELRDQYPRSQPHPAHSFDSSGTIDLGKTLMMKGDITAAEDLVIQGRVVGTISVRDHVLTIAKGAKVNADIKAHKLVIEGQVTGNVTIDDQLEVAAGGVLVGDVKSPSLIIRDGGTLKGSVDMAVEGGAEVAAPVASEAPAEPQEVSRNPEQKNRKGKGSREKFDAREVVSMR